MALNFGLLNQGGPTNFFEGYSQGQEKMQANAMAQQRAAQAQQEFGMRQQEFAAGQAEKKRLSTAAIVTQKQLLQGKQYLTPVLQTMLVQLN